MRDGTPSEPLLFLSHAGADPGAARVLKQRIEQAPEARERGLKVWFDKDNLRAGEPWQKQLEDTIGQQATAFAVYVGSRGVINWVEAEVAAWTITCHRRQRSTLPVYPRSCCRSGGLGRIAGLCPAVPGRARLALTAIWQHRNAYGGDLLQSYTGIGRVEGALALAAKNVYAHILGGDAKETEIAADFIRLDDRFHESCQLS